MAATNRTPNNERFENVAPQPLVLAIGDRVKFTHNYLTFPGYPNVGPSGCDDNGPTWSWTDREEGELMVIVDTTLYENGTVHYGTNAGAWFERGHFNFVRHATAEELLTIGRRFAGDEEDEFSDEDGGLTNCDDDDET